jgi:hypothetical protein
MGSLCRQAWRSTTFAHIRVATILAPFFLRALGCIVVEVAKLAPVALLTSAFREKRATFAFIRKMKCRANGWKTVRAKLGDGCRLVTMARAVL